jgi:hypothetical protein
MQHGTTMKIFYFHLFICFKFSTKNFYRCLYVIVYFHNYVIIEQDDPWTLRLLKSCLSTVTRYLRNCTSKMFHFLIHISTVCVI